MPARMARYYGGYVLDSISRIHGPATEIHVLEPHRVKLLIEPVEAFPDVAAGDEECSCGLLDRPRLVQIAIQITIVTVYGIAGPHPIQAEQFEYQRRGGREAADRESP